MTLVFKTQINGKPTFFPEKIIAGLKMFADRFLKHISVRCETIVFAWGNFNVLGRDTEVKAMFPNAKALQINKNGSPKHQLYVKTNIELVSYCE